MPWEHCGREVLDDQPCAACGITKAAWTVEWDRTRNFIVRGATARAQFVRLQVVDHAEQRLGGEPFVVELPGGAVVEGTLDEYGTAKLPAKTSGSALVRFPRWRDRLELSALPAAHGASPAAELAADAAALRCATHPSLAHCLRLARRSDHAGACAWDRRRTHLGRKVALGFKAAGAAPRAVSFAVFAGDAATPCAVLEATRRADRFVARAAASWGPPPDEVRVARYRFRALDADGRPIGESPALLVRVHRVLQV